MDSCSSACPGWARGVLSTPTFPLPSQPDALSTLPSRGLEVPSGIWAPGVPLWWVLPKSPLLSAPGDSPWLRFIKHRPVPAALSPRPQTHSLPSLERRKLWPSVPSPPPNDQAHPTRGSLLQVTPPIPRPLLPYPTVFPLPRCDLSPTFFSLFPSVPPVDGDSLFQPGRALLLAIPENPFLYSSVSILLHPLHQYSTPWEGAGRDLGLWPFIYLLKPLCTVYSGCENDRITAEWFLFQTKLCFLYHSLSKQTALMSIKTLNETKQNTKPS